MRLVVIESPYAGDIETNVEYAKCCVLDCLDRGEAPLASHLLYTQVLDDKNVDQRELGLLAGWMWMDAANLVAVYIDRGISPGMKRGIGYAFHVGTPVEFRSLRTRTTMPVLVSSSFDAVLESMLSGEPDQQTEPSLPFSERPASTDQS